MMEPELFFDLEDAGLEELIPAGQPVWKALDGLKAFLEAQFQGAWPLAGVTGPVEQALAIYNGELLEGVELRGGEKSKPQVFN